MEGLVQDFHSALDETVDVDNAQSCHPDQQLLPKGSATPARRRAWRRRCKSTSNLANLPGGDSSDSSDGESAPAASASSVVKNASGTTTVGATAANAKTKKAIKMALAAAAAAAAASATSGGDKGTSSLQMSDSDELSTTTNASGRKLQRDSSMRKKRCSLGSSSAISAAIDVANAAAAAVSAANAATAESDSLNENLNVAAMQGGSTVVPEPMATASSSAAIAVAVQRPNTKRKRKFKRMAVDPNTSAIMATGASSSAPDASAMDIANSALSSLNSGGKRPKVRNRMYYYSPSPDSQISVPSNRAPSSSSAAASVTGFFVPGKRKRSNREKSAEPAASASDHRIPPGVGVSAHRGSQFPAAVPGYFQRFARDKGSRMMMMPMEAAGAHQDGDQHMMDCEDNTSSLSSSDWEDAGQDADSLDALQAADEAGVHADDEQSDWPGAADDDDSVSVPGGSLSFALDDDNGGGDDLSSDSLSAFFAGHPNEPSPMMPMTATARNTYLARMKRLAECVPGREIRAGARKLLHNRSAFTIKSSSSEQLSRFLQDSSRTELRLTVTRPADRSKVVQMANLYSLSVRLEPASNLLVLSKTIKTVRVTKEFVGAGAGGVGGGGGSASSRAGGVAGTTPAVEFKRRRRTPPPHSPPSAGDVPSPNQMSTSSAAAATDVSMSSSEVHPAPLLPNRSESPVLGASAGPSYKDKFSGSLSS